MTEKVEEFGNPFLDESNELVSLDSNLVSNKKVLYEFEQKGKEQFEEFRKKVSNEKFYSPITKNNDEIFQSSFELKKNKKQIS